MKRIYFTITISMVLLLVACKKNNTGGDVTIVATPQHHGEQVFAATAYITYKQKDQPSDPLTNYDLKIVGDPAEDHVHIKGMLPGDYYIYMTAYDSTEAITVMGGGHTKIKWKERKEAEIDAIIPVSE